MPVFESEADDEVVAAGWFILKSYKRRQGLLCSATSISIAYLQSPIWILIVLRTFCAFASKSLNAALLGSS